MRWFAGLAPGAWMVAWLLLYRWAALSDRLLGDALPARNRGVAFQAFTTREELAIYAALLIVPAILWWLWCALEEWLQIDPDDAARASVRWSIRAMLRWPIIAMFLLAVVPYSALVFVAAALITPFAILNDRSVRGDRFQFAKPQWPGLMPLIAALTCVIGCMPRSFCAWPGSCGRWPASR